MSSAKKQEDAGVKTLCAAGMHQKPRPKTPRVKHVKVMPTLDAARVGDNVYKNAMRSKRSQIMDKIDVSVTFLAKLLDSRVITHDQFHRIKEATVPERADKLLDILEKQPRDTFPAFLHILDDDGQQHVASLLKNSPAENDYTAEPSGASSRRGHRDKSVVIKVQIANSTSSEDSSSRQSTQSDRSSDPTTTALSPRAADADKHENGEYAYVTAGSSPTTGRLESLSRGKRRSSGAHYPLTTVGLRRFGSHSKRSSRHFYQSLLKSDTALETCHGDVSPTRLLCEILNMKNEFNTRLDKIIQLLQPVIAVSDPMIPDDDKDAGYTEAQDDNLYESFELPATEKASTWPTSTASGLKQSPPPMMTRRKPNLPAKPSVIQTKRNETLHNALCVARESEAQRPLQCTPLSSERSPASKSPQRTDDTVSTTNDDGRSEAAVAAAPTPSRQPLRALDDSVDLSAPPSKNLETSAVQWRHPISRKMSKVVELAECRKGVYKE